MDYEYNGNSYKFSGLFYDIFQILSEKYHIKIIYKPIQNEESVKLLEDNEVNCIACLFKTFARVKTFDFSSCFYTVSVGGLIRESESRIRTQSDLMNSDIKIAAVKGEVGAEIVKEIFKVNKDTKRLMELETPNVGSVASLVEMNAADIAITDNITCKLVLKRPNASSLKHIFVDYPLYLGQVGLMVRTNEEEFRD